MILFGGPTFISSKTAGGAGQSHGESEIDPGKIVEALKKKGYRSAYAPKVKLAQTEKIREIRTAFEEADIVIAEVGGWNNLLDTDLELRKKNRDQDIEALSLAEELGARCAINTFGTMGHGTVGQIYSAWNYTQEAFDAAVELARMFIDAVKPKRASFVYEIYPFNVIDTPENILRLIKAVDRDRFGVHMDLANLVNSARTYWQSAELIQESVRLFGDRIVSSHLKDILLCPPSVSVILKEVRAGLGGLDIAAYLKALNGLDRDVPLLMEHLKGEEEYDLAAEHVRSVAGQEGISL